MWLVLVSIYCVYKAIQNRNVVGPGQRSWFLVLTKRSAASGDENAPRCAAISVYCSVRDWTRFLRHRIRKYPDSPVHTLSDSLQIYFFHSGERIYFFPDSLSNSLDACGSRIRKEKVADSKISGYVWTGPKRRLFQVSVHSFQSRSVYCRF